MRPPQTAPEALSFIKAAVRDESYTPLPHFLQRMALRRVSMNSALEAIRRARGCEPYPGSPEHGGTCWRVHGKDTEGRTLAIGVEAWVDALGRAVILCTLFETRSRR